MKAFITYDKKIKSKVIVHNQDLWNGDHTLALIIYPFLKKYKKYAIEGFPSSFINDWDNNDDKKSSQEWHLVLDKMIFSFECIAKNKTFVLENRNCIERLEFSEEEIKKQMDHEKRIQEGIDLFGKYFQNLWI